MPAKLKYSPEKVEEICKHLSNGMGRIESCTLAKINFDTFCQWMKDPRKPEFADAVKDAEVGFEETNLFIIQKAALKSWQAAAWLLERKFQDKYAIKSKWEVSGPGGRPILPTVKPIDLSRFSIDELQRLLKVADTLPTNGANTGDPGTIQS